MISMALVTQVLSEPMNLSVRRLSTVVPFHILSYDSNHLSRYLAQKSMPQINGQFRLERIPSRFAI